MSRSLLGLCLLLFAAPAGAQTPPPPERTAHKVTVMDFDDEIIESGREAPQVEATIAKPKASHEGVIRVREQFRDKVLQSASQL